MVLFRFMASTLFTYCHCSAHGITEHRFVFSVSATRRLEIASQLAVRIKISAKQCGYPSSASALLVFTDNREGSSEGHCHGRNATLFVATFAYAVDRSINRHPIMQPYLPTRSHRAADRRAGKLVFRGYSEKVRPGDDYPKKLRTDLLIEAPNRAAVEQEFRQVASASVRSGRSRIDGFFIVEIHPDDSAEELQTWVYDDRMRLRGHLVHDRRVRFSGREPGDCAFAIGDQVACRLGGRYVLGRIARLPVSPAEAKAGENRGLYIAIGGPTPDASELYADQTDDRYTVEWGHDPVRDLYEYDPFPECFLKTPDQSSACGRSRQVGAER